MIGAVSGSGHYTVDPARVVSEIIDGEAIIINLANGYYYSLDATAAEIWAGLLAGRSASEIASALQRRYDCSGADPGAAVLSFIADLQADDLITAGPAPESAASESPASDGASRAPFRPPVLQRFSDMQGFLLVDPIHEVDDAGWPHPKPGEPSARR